MSYRITGLNPESFRDLFGLSDEALAARGVQRMIVDHKPGYPDRVEMRDLEPGESVLLLNYTHQPSNTPYHASHAIFVREHAGAGYNRVDEVPQVLRTRPISLRAFDAADMMIDADLVEGDAVEERIKQFLANPRVAYLQAHYAKRGCYAGRVERASAM